jgi:transcriptional regulator with XRE-family HTH domain
VKPLNLIGKQVRKLRAEKGWTQQALAAKLQMIGWDVSRISIAKLEGQLRRVPDGEVLFLAKVFRVETDKLFPPSIVTGRIKYSHLGSIQMQPP